MSTPTIFYQPSAEKADVSILEGQISSLKADLAPIKADLASATATSAGSVGGTLVRRDANKDFEASKLKLWHLESAGSTLSIAGNNETQTLNIGSGSGMQTINMGNNGTGATVINLGGGSDQVKVNLPLKNSTGANILQVSAYTTPGQANVAVGSNVLPSNGANGNTMVGSDIAVDGTMNGGYNTGMGSIAMQGLTSGVGNSGYGHRALNSVTTGGHNVGVGFRAGSEPNDMTKSLTTGSRNTLIGADTRTASNAQVNSTALGNGAVVEADNTIQLGNPAVTLVKTSGNVFSAAVPTTAAHLTNKLYVDTQITANVNARTDQNLKTTDVVTFAGLKLPTTGGTASTLDFYESMTFSTQQSTPFSGPIQANFYITRIGNTVTLQLCSSTLGTPEVASSFATYTPLPVRFRPITFGGSAFIPIYNGSPSDLSTGIVTVDTSGYITIQTLNMSNSGKFSASGQVGYRGFTMTYIIRSETFT